MKERPEWARLAPIEEILLHHSASLKRYGGLASGDVEDCVAGELGNAWTAQEYVEPIEAKRGLSFAAYALYYLAKRHCFTDGNKRASWIAAMVVLARLGLSIQATEEEAEGLMIAVCNDEMDATDVIDWFSERIEVIN